MFSNKYKVVCFRGLVPLVVSSLLLLCSCRFGDEDSLDSLAKRTRSLTYFTSVTLPTLSYSDEPVEDWGTEGLNLNWGKSVELAVFADEFVTSKDSTGKVIEPDAFHLAYDYYQDATLQRQTQPAVLDFQFTTQAKHGYGDKYATEVNLVYPYSKALDGSGTVRSAYCDSLAMDFTGQDGKLTTVRDKYFLALGKARAVSSKNEVTLLGSDEDSVVQLQPKVAIVRFSLIVPAQRDYSLLEFLHGLNMTQPGHYIERITLTNRQADAGAISRAWLNLESGWMESQRNAISSLTLSDANLFWNHEEIQQGEAQPLRDAGDGQTSWGTSFYVAFPCVEEGTLPLDLQLTVNVRRSGTTPDQDYHFYGTIQPVTLEEGGYYVTSAVRLQMATEEATEPASICKVP